MDKTGEKITDEALNESAESIENESVDKADYAETESRAYAPISLSLKSVTVPSYSSAIDVSISCADSTWKAGTVSGWTYMQKISQTQAKIVTESNTGAIRKRGVTAVNGPNTATVLVTQAANINVKNKITLYKQVGLTCAATCACMCVNVDPNTVPSNWMENAQWGAIGNLNGYSLAVNVLDYADSDVSQRPTFQSVYNVSLAKGLPAIVKINTGSLQHWVVLVAFSGTDVNDPSKYICADPVSGDFVRLDQAINYGCVDNKFFNRVVYQKN